ncbi:hypothetical protein [Kineosporia succinea]|uniref:Helix-turn-helix protein n=1 Tax=Kineosporia succinea TaxID=84632 RepID=A0ABT9P7P6_9ACTN|nr:hypothetical protein [Kineosporia succinea]MDP9828065.1 hypothetical protein [Kineosporia succinea]
MNGDQVLIDAPAERPCTHQRVHHHHGTLGRYVSDRCRCRPCRDAHTAYHRDRTTQLAHGSWQKYADAEPVRQHLRQLMSAGLWQTTIAARSGVGLATIARLLRTKGPPVRVRTSTAAALLAITAGPTTTRTASALFTLKEDV